MMLRIFPLSLLFLSLLATQAFGDAAKLDFFEKKIRPVLAEKCYGCHSATAKKLKGHLMVDHIDHLLTGGDTGAAIVPGDPDKSLLIETVSYETPDLQMPPKGPISKESVEDFRKWIADGAIWPDEPVTERGEGMKVDKFDLQKRFDEHWSWRPIQNPAVPQIKADAAPIDQFILSKVQDANLTPAAPASKRVWLRRVYFDLIGLPPTPEQIAAFLADDSADAKVKVVDELLGSPHYGERWARHWMDLMRYAETYGHEFDYPIHYAHEYRDYLIRAFNADVPYDDFLTEHLAGDLLKEPRREPETEINESLIATGFWHFHEATHAPTDVKQDEADHMDNQIDVFGKTFLGLTISCARCHDHKFDAISTADYYAMAAYLESSHRVEAPLDPGRAREKSIAQLSELQHQADPLFAKIDPNLAKTLRLGDHFQTALELVRAPSANSPSEQGWDGQVYADFETDYGDWKATGKAFGKKPAGEIKPQRLSGQTGTTLANSFNGGDGSTGMLQSPPFTIEKRFINFKIGGGKHAKTAMELWIDGKPVRKKSGHDSDAMKAASWNVEALIGQSAHLRIIDEHRGGWGHVIVDHITFADLPVAATGATPLPANFRDLAQSRGLSPDRVERWFHLLQTEPSKKMTPEVFFANWVRNEKTLPNTIQQAAGLKNHLQQIDEQTTVFARFDGPTLPENWHTTGEAIHPSPRASLSFSKEKALTLPQRVSSDQFGQQQNGVLRSPSFEITTQKIFVKAQGENLFLRVMPEHYHMAVHSGLLFNGTLLKNQDTQGNSQWFEFNVGKYIGTKAMLEFVDKGNATLQIEEIRFGDGGRPPQMLHPLVEALVTSEHAITTKPFAYSVDEVFHDALSGIAAGKITVEDAAIINWLIRQDLITLDELSPELSKLRDQGLAIAASLPAERYAVATGAGSDEGTYVYVRGSHRSLGEPVVMRNLTALGGEPGGRLELANSLTTLENPLVARVMVNRVWHHLFGRGIVPSVDDFGPMGQLASHPELLDWLATDFVAKDWSIKELIRSLVLTDTYAQASVAHPDNAADHLAVTDPTNTLLHRMPVKRLQSEAIRDSILAVSGQLDRTLHGPSIATHKTKFMSGRGSRGNGPLDGAGRRSIYGAVYRNFLSPFMLTFDQPSPFGPKGRRSVSNVPAQALTLMNDPFVVGQAKHWAKQELAVERTTEERLAVMYEKALGTPPTDSQIQALNQFLTQQLNDNGKNPEPAWADLAHVLINSKGFIYLD